MKFKIKKKDKVVVISGKDKGKTGDILEIISGDGFRPTRVLVSKVNLVTKSRKPSQADAGGLIKMEAPLSISKVMLVDPKTNKATRIKIKTLANGDKVRTALKSGETIA